MERGAWKHPLLMEQLAVLVGPLHFLLLLYTHVHAPLLRRRLQMAALGNRVSHRLASCYRIYDLYEVGRGMKNESGSLSTFYCAGRLF